MIGKFGIDLLMVNRRISLAKILDIGKSAVKAVRWIF